MDGSAPKINVAPSSGNTTPEAIRPTVTEQAAAQATKAPADNLVEIEGSVGDQNLIVEEQDMVPPSIAPLPHTPSVTQPGASGGDEMKVQEATRVEENAKVEVPVPNTQVYEPPPQPSLDSDAINACLLYTSPSPRDS